MLPLIWGCDQHSPAAADWHDGQIMHDTHARFAHPGKSRNHVCVGFKNKGNGERGVVVCLWSATRVETTMRLMTITLAAALALASSLALAQGSGSTGGNAATGGSATSGVTTGASTNGTTTGTPTNGGISGTAGSAAAGANSGSNPSGNTFINTSPSGSTVGPAGAGSGRR
jgi:hypothetical protein